MFDINYLQEEKYELFVKKGSSPYLPVAGSLKIIYRLKIA